MGLKLVFRRGSCGASARRGGDARTCSLVKGRGTPPMGWSSQQEPGPCPAPRLQLHPTLSAGIIDLSQVPHLPVLVPPTPGTPATAMDRLAYLPTAPQHFSSRLSSSPLSPGNSFTLILGQDPGV